MPTYAIDPDNNITALLKAPSAAAEGEIFPSEKQLAKVSAAWPAARLVEIWNSFAGTVPFDDLRPVKKFTDRKAAVSRLWKAAQRLTPTVGAHGPQVATQPPVGTMPSPIENGSDDAHPITKTAPVLELR